MNTQPNYIIKAPLLTEESTLQRDAKQHYVFKVDHLLFYFSF
jgi:ribosomal protein L23